MTEITKAGKIRAWLADPVFMEILADMREGAVSRAMNAKPDEAEKITQALADARAVENFRSTLNALARDEANSTGRRAPA